MRIRLITLIAMAAMAAMWGRPAAAQQLRGTIREGASALPVPGAVVIALDSTGQMVGRNIADADGRYTVRLRAPARQLQVVRIGFRPLTLTIDAQADVTVVDVALTAIPTLLEHVRVVADRSQCPARADAAETLALIDQARAGLLATVVAREANPASVMRVVFDRTLDANGLTPVAMSVRMEPADRATVSFNAAQTAVDFAVRGFAADTGADRTYLGPDADVLLDDSFAAAYCFRIAEPDPDRRALVGLGFAAARPKAGRVDIDGTLWIDTVARRLHSTEFQYRGLDDVSTGFGAGGTVSFREVQPGIVLIDRWTLRLVGGTDAPGAAQSPTGRQYEIHEIGGELASAQWPDGRSWSAPLGTLRIAATTTAGDPLAPGTSLGLVNTDYRAEVDLSGSAEFTQLVPGPYAVMAIDRKLADLGLTIPTGLSFHAERDSVVSQRVRVPTASEFVASLCSTSGRLSATSAWLIGRIGQGDGAAVPAAKWRLSRSGAGGWSPVADGGATGSSGLFTHCRNLAVGQTVRLQAWRQGEAPTVLVRTLDEKLTVIPVLLPTAVVVRGGGAAPLAGTVLDSALGTQVRGAYLEVAGTQFTAISDSAGRFTIDEVPRGTYTVEVRTPELDALGAVGRTTLTHDGRSPAQVYVPTTAQLVAAMCGPESGPGTGVLLGSIQLTGEGQIPDGVRLVAEWNDRASPMDQSNVQVGRTQWRWTSTDVNGVYRLCGLPLNSALLVRTQADSGVDAATLPQQVTVDAAKRFTRLDLMMEPGLQVDGAFAGVVLSDSTNERLAGAEVALPDLRRTIVTNIDGEFRINDIPPGTHRVTISRPGFLSITASVAFAANQTVDHRIVLGRPITTLGPVTVTEAPSVNETFDTNRRLGLGRFLTSEDLQKNAGRNLSDAFAIIAGPGAVLSTAAGRAGYVTARRMPAHLPPRIGAPMLPLSERNPCGNAQTLEARATLVACNNIINEMREQGIFCPETGQQRTGIGCACYAQVWVNGRLMNNQRPTEPFDINQYPPETLAGVEWYATPSQTPAQYSSLNAVCGVLALWTRQTAKLPPGQPTTQER